MHPIPWFERRFELGLPAVMFPYVVERVRGTPARLEDRVSGLSPDSLRLRIEGMWSIQENVGHLGDLESLWSGRLDELLAGETELRPADLENRKTHGARHNERPIEELLGAFRRDRLAIVERLDSLTSSQLDLTALHPRLGQPMSAVDLFFFVAEHDDHHLAQITGLIHKLTSH